MKKAKHEKRQRQLERDNAEELDPSKQHQIELYAKKRKFLEIKDCVCMSYVVRCILGPTSY